MSKLFQIRKSDIAFTPGIMPMDENLWFKEHQSLLLAIANHPDGRDLLCIDKSLPAIIEISKKHVTCFLDIDKKGHLIKITDFRVGAKWANIIRYRWREFSKIAKEFYSHSEFGLHRHDVSGLLAATTSTFYPDPDPETTTVDGYVYRATAAAGEAWGTIRTGNGVTVQSAITNMLANGTRGGTTSNLYQRIYRCFSLFDTSSIGGDTINSSDYDLYYTTGSFANGLLAEASANSAVVLLETTPNSNTDIITSDYESGHYTAAGGVNLGEGGTQDSITDGYNDTITVNASGLALIDGSGVTKFGTTSKWDFDNTTTGLTWGSNQFQYSFASTAEETGTSQDPKLTVIHTAPTGVVPFRRRIEGY